MGKGTSALVRGQSSVGSRAWIEVVEPRTLLATVSGMVWNDLNNDGIKQSREKWFSLEDSIAAQVGLWIDLDGNGKQNGSEPYQTLSKEGTYSLSADTAGPIAVRMAYSIDTTKQTVGIYAPVKVVVPSATQTNFPNQNIPMRKAIVVSGEMFFDINANGTKDTDETSRGDAIVYYDADNNGVRAPDEPFTPFSGPLGYTNSKFQITVPEGPGVLRVSTFETIDYTVPPINYTAVIGTNQTKNFAIRPEMVVQGRIFKDVDGNGKRTAGEAYVGAGAVRAWLDFNNDGVWNSDSEPSSATDASGNYHILNRKTSAKFGVNIRFRLSPTKPIASTSRLQRLVFKTIQETQTYNFGFAPASVKVRVIKDLDSSKTFTPGDSALQGAVVYIDKNRNGVLNSGEITATTDVDGFVTFKGVLPTEDPKELTIRVRYSTTKNNHTTDDPIVLTVIPLEQANTVFGIKPK